MPTRDHYMTVARQIADYLNAFRLAFKTYKVSELDEMMSAVAGAGSRISTETSAADFSNLLLERGFSIFPSITDTADGYVRVIRANSIVANLLSALRYPGADGDAELARLLRTLTRRRADDLGGADEAQ